MKIKLTQNEIATLEVFVLDTIDSNKMKNIKSKFLNSDRFGFVHLSDEQYLYILTCCENNMMNDIIPIYESLIKQDTRYLVKPLDINTSII